MQRFAALKFFKGYYKINPLLFFKQKP